MAASPASFAQLGLPPNADRAAVDRAYRALMKRHHPDLGGDPERAASINHAYADITRQDLVPAVEETPTDLAAALYQRHQALRASGRAAKTGNGARWRIWLIPAVILFGIAWTERDSLTDLAWDLQWRYFPPVRDASGGGDNTPTAIGQHVQLGSGKLDGEAILTAEAQARSMLKSGGGGAAAAADYSRRCYLAFQADPSIAGYDRCVGFDDAILLLGGNGVADKSGFSAGAVTGRQLAAARMLDSDYESIETRIDRIRLAMMRRLQLAAEPSDQPAAGG